MVFAARIPAPDELRAHYLDYGHAWQDSPITRARYQELLKSFEPYRRTNRILDFGCGAGYFLEEARLCGWEVHGTEFSGLALQMARSKGLEVTAAPIDRSAFPPGHFDVVSAFEVFEHVSDPLAEAGLVAHLVRPGGLLYCTTPNFDALSRRLLGPGWNVIGYPEHLCYFTAQTLRRWLEGAGFVTQSVLSTGLSVSRLRHESPSTAVEAGTTCGDEQLRQAIEASRALRLGKDVANRLLSSMHLGDTLKGHFRRDGGG